MTVPSGNLMGEFIAKDGRRLTVYRRHNAVTLFHQRGYEVVATHLKVETAGALGKLLVDASETTTYDEEAAS